MEQEFAAFLALDWGDRKHAWALQSAGGKPPLEQGELENTPEAVEQWAMELAQRFGGQPVALALEQSRGAVVAMLGKYEHLVLYPIHPTTLANYRKGFYPSGAKDDPGDARIALDLLVRHRERLRVLRPDTVETRLLQFLGEARRKLVDDRTGHANRLRALLKQYFPQLLKWFGDPDSALIAALLKRWPNLPALQRARPATVSKFLKTHRCGNQERRDQVLEQIATAVPATHDPALLRSAELEATSLVDLIASLGHSIDNYNREIKAAVRAHPDFFIVDSFPGVGEAMGPRLLAACGSDRERYQTARELQCFSGIAPVVASSGQQRWVHWRWACPKFVRQTFHEWAQHSLAKSAWARAYYDQQRARNKTHHAAVRALAFKWIRILFRCWKDRKPYQEHLYAAALSKRVSRPAPQPSPDAVLPQIQWKSCAGFHKPTLPGA